MEEKLKQEIQNLTEELSAHREQISDMKKLVGREIDRQHKLDLWELSEKELDSEMGSHLSLLNEDIDTRPERLSLTSHRRIVGPIIVAFKKLLLKMFDPYTNTLLDRQRKFNEETVHFQLATFIRLRQIQERLDTLQQTIHTLRLEQLSPGESPRPATDEKNGQP